MRPIETPRQFVECFLRSRSRLESPGSALGGQLEALRHSVDGSLFIRDDGDASRAALGPMSRLVEHGWLALIWGSLHPEEQAALELSHTPKASYQVSVERRVSDMDGIDGAELLRLLYDDDGELTDMGVYSVTEPLTHSPLDIAERLGLTERQARRRISTGNARIRERLDAMRDDESVVSNRA